MLPLDSGPVGLNDLAVGGHFACSLIIVAMFIRLGGGGGGIFKLSYGGKPQRDGTIFMKEVDPLRHHVTILI